MVELYRHYQHYIIIISTLLRASYFTEDHNRRTPPAVHEHQTDPSHKETNLQRQHLRPNEHHRPDEGCFRRCRPTENTACRFASFLLPSPNGTCCSSTGTRSRGGGGQRRRRLSRTGRVHGCFGRPGTKGGERKVGSCAAKQKQSILKALLLGILALRVRKVYR